MDCAAELGAIGVEDIYQGIGSRGGGDAGGYAGDAQFAVGEQGGAVKLIDAAVLGFALHEESAGGGGESGGEHGQLIAHTEGAPCGNTHEDGVVVMADGGLGGDGRVAGTLSQTHLDRGAGLQGQRTVHPQGTGGGGLEAAGDDAATLHADCARHGCSQELTAVLHGDGTRRHGRGGRALQFQRAAGDVDGSRVACGLQRQLARTYLVDAAGGEQSAEDGVLVQVAYRPGALRAAQGGIGGCGREGTDLRCGSHLAAASAGVVGDVGAGIDDEAGLGHVGDVRHQTEVAAFALHGQPAFELREVCADVAAHVFRADGEVAAAPERAVDLASRGADDGVGGTLLNGDDMVQHGHGGTAVHVEEAHLAARQQHGAAGASEGGVPCTLCHDALLDDDAGKVIGAAVGEVQLSGAVLHQIAGALDLSLQRERAVLLADADGGGVGEGDDAVGAHVVLGEDECAAVQLEVAFLCRGSSEGALLASVVEVGHGQRSAVDDGLAGVVAVFHVQRHVGFLLHHDIACAADASVARQRVFAALEGDAVGGQQLVEGDVLLLSFAGEDHGVAGHEGGGAIGGEVLCLVVPGGAFGSGPYHSVGRLARLVDDEQQPLAVHLQVVVDALESACLQLRRVAGECAGAFGNDIRGCFLVRLVHGDVVGALEGEVALHPDGAAYGPYAVGVADEASRNLDIDIPRQGHAFHGGYLSHRLISITGHEAAALVVQCALEGDGVAERAPTAQGTFGSQFHGPCYLAVDLQRPFADDGLSRVAQISRYQCLALHRLDELSRARGDDGVGGSDVLAQEDVVMRARIHYIYSACVPGLIHLDVLGVVACDVEHQALAVGVGGRGGHVERRPLSVSLPAQVADEHRRQWRQRHIAAEVEACVGMLVVAACGAVAAVVGILLQAVDAVVGGHRRGVAHEAGAVVGTLLGQDDFLAPVAGDVAHERRARAGAALGRPSALLREFYEAVAQHLGNHHVGAPAGAAGRVEPFALQGAVPPHALEHRAGACLSGLLALAVIDEFIGIAQDLVALAGSVEVEACTAPHVVNRRQVPLLDALGRGGVVEALSQERRLLNGKAFQAGTVGVDVADDEAVAVLQTGRGEAVLCGIHAVAAGPHLVAAVAVAVEDADLVELCAPGALGVAHPRVAVVPVRGFASLPVEVPREDVAVVGSARVAVLTFHDERRMQAVEVGDAIVSFHGAVAEVHVVRAVVAPVVVASVAFRQLGVFQFVPCQFGTRLAIDDRDVERRVAPVLRAVVRDAVGVGVGRSLAADVASPGVAGLVPEAGAVARTDDDFTAAVAVDVVGQYHVVLSGADIHVRPHVHRPEQFARQAVGLYLVGRRGGVVALVFGIVAARGSGKQTIADHGVELAVAIEVHGPDVLRAVVVAPDDLVVEVEVEPHVWPRL